ncbi:hypothetical protein Leryth_022977 [Lithospermum erythrorhizon]|nr:hypothetical protein Leryth_022977 [Lithospermum erythrorhizon]
MARFPQVESPFPFITTFIADSSTCANTMPWITRVINAAAHQQPCVLSPFPIRTVSHLCIVAQTPAQKHFDMRVERQQHNTFSTTHKWQSTFLHQAPCQILLMDEKSECLCLFDGVYRNIDHSPDTSACCLLRTGEISLTDRNKSCRAPLRVLFIPRETTDITAACPTMEGNRSA